MMTCEQTWINLCSNHIQDSSISCYFMSLKKHFVLSATERLQRTSLSQQVATLLT